MSATRIAIVEDDPATRARFSGLFDAQDDFELVAAHESGAGALALLDRESIDVLIVDLGLPDINGIEVIRACALRQPHCDPVVVTVFGGEEQVLECLAAGATGYLLKDDMPGAIVDCIRMLRNGGSPVSPGIARRLLRHFRQTLAPPRPIAPDRTPTTGGAEQISERESEILERIAKGLTCAEIGNLLHISEHTVGTHVKNIYRKLAVHSRTEAVYEARKMGLLRD